MRETKYHPPIPEALPVTEPSIEGPNPRLAGALETLEQGIESVLSDEGFASYLWMLSKFHDYSFT